MFTSSTIKLIIADKQNVVIQGLRDILNKINHIEIIGETDNGQELLDCIREQPPDIVIADVNLHKLNTLNVIRNLKVEAAQESKSKKLPQFLIFTAECNRQIIYSFFLAGVRGYLSKQAKSEEIIQAIYALQQQQVNLSPVVQTILIDMLVSIHRELSTIELRIIREVAQGKKNRDISLLLNITEGTVKNHLNNIYRKLPPVRSRAEAATWVWFNQ